MTALSEQTEATPSQKSSSRLCWIFVLMQIVVVFSTILTMQSIEESSNNELKGVESKLEEMIRNRDDKQKLLRATTNVTKSYPLPLNARTPGGAVHMHQLALNPDREQGQIVSRSSSSDEPKIIKVPSEEEGSISDIAKTKNKVSTRPSREYEELKREPQKHPDSPQKLPATQKSPSSAGSQVTGVPKTSGQQHRIVHARQHRGGGEGGAGGGAESHTHEPWGAWTDDFAENGNCSQALRIPQGKSRPPSRLAEAPPLSGHPSIKAIAVGVGTTGTTTIHRTMCQHKIPSSHWGWSCNVNEEDQAELNMHKWIDQWMTPLLDVSEGNKQAVAALESGKLQKRPPQDVLMGALTGGLEGIADSPISFEPRLMTWLPDAKVILTLRDPEKWWASRVKNHAGDFMCNQDLWDKQHVRAMANCQIAPLTVPSTNDR